MLYSLFVTCGNDYGKSFVLNEQTVTIGRDQNSSVLLEDGEVSRLHCTLSAESSKVFLVDEESSNGTFLNGLAIARAQVRKGDKIRVGNTQLEFNSVLQISLDQEDFSPLTVSPTKVNKNSAGRKNSAHGIESARIKSGQISTFTEHRINNILQGLSGGAHLVQTGLDSGDIDLSKKGWGITKANQIRVTELVRDFMTLNSQLTPEPKLCDLAKTIANAVDSLKPKFANLNFQFPPTDQNLASVDYRSIQTCLRYVLRLVADATGGERALVEFSILQDEQMFHIAVRYPGHPIQISPNSEADIESDYCGIAGLVLEKVVAALDGKLAVGAATTSAESCPAEPGNDTVRRSEVVLSFPLETN